MKFLRNDPTVKHRRRELRHNQTEAEKALWQRIRNRLLYGMKFFRQYSIGPYILDFYCSEMKLAIELDGGQHNECEHKEYDVARSEYLKTQGIEVIRFWNYEVLANMSDVLARIEVVANPTQSGSITPPSPSYLKRGKIR